MRLLALALAALLITPRADACPAPMLVDISLIADGATLLDDGGIVIETRNGGGRGALPDGSLVLKTGGTTLNTTQEYLAAGLSILRPPRGNARTIEVVDGGGQVRLTLTQAKGTAFAAPKPAQITSTLPRARSSKQPPQPRYGIDASAAKLTLAEAPPTDVIAIVVFAITKDGPQGRAWWHRNATELTYTFSTGGKGCVPGPTPLHQGEKVAIGFVDSHGRTSLLSKHLVVAAAKASRR